uniref:Uncharacterized protein n=1 Tax=Hyaloperonospora arabidopsidis (strain Emoy2) TaxID=559515 RepID=M4BET3_HYAAE
MAVFIPALPVEPRRGFCRGRATLAAISCRRGRHEIRVCIVGIGCKFIRTLHVLNRHLGFFTI